MLVTRGGEAAQKLNLEGIAADGAGGFRLASEGRSDRLVPHALLHVDAEGKVDQEIALPDVLLDNEVRYGLEGVAVVGDVIWLAVQREWQDDPAGMTRLLAYDTVNMTWGAVRYPLEAPAATEGAWMGLSELTLHGDYLYLIERDNRIGANAAVKILAGVKLADLAPAALGGALPVVSKEVVRDLIPDLAAANGVIAEKVEGFAVDAAGMGWLVIDNDGTNDSSGESLFRSIGLVN